MRSKSLHMFKLYIPKVLIASAHNFINVVLNLIKPRFVDLYTIIHRSYMLYMKHAYCTVLYKLHYDLVKLSYT